MSIFTVAKYLRISSEDDDLKEAGKRESNSIANQRDLLDSFIAGTPDFSGAAVVEFCDDGWSGKDFERPAFQKMLTGARQGENSMHCCQGYVPFLKRLYRAWNLYEPDIPIHGGAVYCGKRPLRQP